jgi:Amt family ammonium transporter
MGFRNRIISSIISIFITFCLGSFSLSALSQSTEKSVAPSSAGTPAQVDMLELAKRSIEAARQQTPSTSDTSTARTDVRDAAATAPSAASSSQPAPAPPAAQKIEKPTLVDGSQINRGDTAWMIVATVFVFLMTLPGVALFYGGMVRKKNVLGIMTQSFGAMAVVSIMWVAVGHTIAFSDGNAFIGDASRIFLRGLTTLNDGHTTVHPLAPTIPESVFVMYEMMFAVIATALVAGAFAERVTFSATLIFCALWSVLVYAPIAHMAWMPNGYLAKLGVLDFAGGNVVHVTAGFAGLLSAYWVGPRKGFGSEVMAPHNLGLTLLGGALLCVGWFGFNAGSALAADGRAGLALLVTHISAVTGALTWALVESFTRRRASSLGVISGAIAGLVAITPASGYVATNEAFIFGVVAGLTGYFGATTLKRMTGCDDSLDVFGIHGLCGMAGGILTGLLADAAIGGSKAFVGAHVIAILITIVYTLVVTSVIWVIVKFLVNLRLTPIEEEYGLDMTQHGEIVE